MEHHPCCITHTLCHHINGEVILALCLTVCLSVCLQALFSINHEHEQEYRMVSLSKDNPFSKTDSSASFSSSFISFFSPFSSPKSLSPPHIFSSSHLFYLHCPLPITFFTFQLSITHLFVSLCSYSNGYVANAKSQSASCVCT